MARALELAEQSETEPGRSAPSPRVGAVAIAADGTFLAEAYRGQQNPGDHAEFCLISSLGTGTGALAGATVYTTLEPCTTRNPPKTPCADRLVAEQVRVVYVGMLDPDARIRELGCKALRDANIDVRDFTADLREQVHRLNQPFVDRFRVATGRQGTATFDYMQNDGRLRIESGDGVVFETQWSMAGKGAAGGYALVRIESVLAGPGRGDPHTEAVISYELRVDEPS